MPAPLFLSGPCEICGQQTSGRHFGVMSCRSCAAFFRRAASSPRKKVECPIGDCQILEDGKFQCKRCRLKRCLDAGMDASKIQNNRDLISTSNKFLKRATVFLTPPQSLSTFLGRPTFILCCEPDKASHSNSFIDVRYLVDKAYHMFHEGPSTSTTPFQYNNSLEKLSLTLDDLRQKQPDQTIMQITKVGKEETMYITEQAFLRTVEWFLSIPEFNELEEFVKLEIVKSAWYCWARLEKLAETADYQRKKVFTEDIFMVGENRCVNACNYEIDLTWCTNYSLEQLLFYVPPQEEHNTRKCIQDLVDLNPSGIEINYMLLQVSLSHVGKKCQGKVLEACDRLLQSQADHLHDYYVNKIRQPNYAARLAKMLKINKVIEEDIRNRAERNYLAKVFHVLKIDYSHPEMFELC